jgi:VCBS repeat-containing protein
MNHEVDPTAVPPSFSGPGIVRAHGSVGSFVSKWIINKTTLAVVSIQDLIPDAAHVFTWNGSTYVAGTTSFTRFCSADLAPASAFLSGGKGTATRLFMNGEESSGGRAFAHLVNSSHAGTSYELPRFGRMAFENSLANPTAQDKTIVMSQDDQSLVSGNASGQLYCYIGTKLTTGTGATEIDDAGLTNGKLYGISVTGFAAEDRLLPMGGVAKGASKPFTLAILNGTGDVSALTGAQLDAASDTASVTRFLRPEDGAWDPTHPADYYFNTTDRIDDLKNGGTGATTPQIGRTRVWKMHFSDIANPELGGTITMILDGAENPGAQMLDNIAIDGSGRLVLQEDSGNYVGAAKMWACNPLTGSLTQIAKHDPAKFGDRVGGVTTAPVAPFTIDEESSGVIDASGILGAGWFLIVSQAHYAKDSETVEGGQLLALYLPAPSVYTNAPTIGSIPRQELSAGASTSAIGFLINDVETPANALLVTVASSNTALVPVANVVIGGSGNSRTVTVTSVAGQTGNATITLTVADGDGGTATTSFLIVTNAAPTISNVTDQTTVEDTATSAIAVTVGDADSSPAGLVLTASSSNVSLVPNANIVLGGSGASRTVTITPATNQNGTTTITLVVTDPQGATATDTFVLTVTAVNDAPVAVNGTATVAAGATVNGTLVATDADANPLVFSKVANPTKGTATVNANGTFSYVANAGTTGTDTFTFKANDGTVDSNVATVTVTITAGGGGSGGSGDDKKDKKCGLGGGIGVLVLSLLLALKGLFVRARR